MGFSPKEKMNEITKPVYGFVISAAGGLAGLKPQKIFLILQPRAKARGNGVVNPVRFLSLLIVRHFGRWRSPLLWVPVLTEAWKQLPGPASVSYPGTGTPSPLR